MFAQPDPLHIIALNAHNSGYPRTKAENRRQRRGMKFPSPHAMIADLRIEGCGVIVDLWDGTRWRVFMRGGKSFRRRLKA